MMKKWHTKYNLNEFMVILNKYISNIILTITQQTK